MLLLWQSKKAFSLKKNVILKGACRRHRQHITTSDFGQGTAAVICVGL